MNEETKSSHPNARDLIAVYLAAPNDRNGNARRGHLILDESGNAVGFARDDSQTPHFARRRFCNDNVSDAPRVVITPREFYSWLSFDATSGEL